MTGPLAQDSSASALAHLPDGSVPTAELAIDSGAAAITDLHLAPLGDDRTRAFCDWADRLDGLPQLLILGDFFDTWVGAKQARIAGSADVLAALRRLSERGTAVHVIPGNRDALLDGSFEDASAATLHPEGFVGILPDGSRAAVVHGDSLCTLDRGYQRLKVWRRAPVRFTSRHAPLWFARWIGTRLRAASENRKPFKLIEEKSIQESAVQSLAAQTRAQVVICGHAHIARDEPIVGGEVTRWIVVGAWREDRRDGLQVIAGDGTDGESGAPLVLVESNSLTRGA